MTPVLAVTTLNDKIIKEYGADTLSLMHKNLDCDLMVCFDEDCAVYSKGSQDIDHRFRGNYMCRASKFADKHQKTKKQGFRHNAAKFAWKVYAMQEAWEYAKLKGYEYLVWLDADIYVKDYIEWWEFEDVVEGYDMAWLDRPHFSHAETGLIIFSVHCPWVSLLLNMMVHLYDSEELFMLKEWHDAYAMTLFVHGFQKSGMKVHNINSAKSGTEAMQYCPFAGKMRHVK